MGAPQPGGAGEAAGVGHQHRRLGVAEDVGHLGVAGVGVHRHHHRAGAEGPQAGEHPPAGGGGVEQHPVAGPDPEPGEPAGHLLDRRGQGLVAELDPATAERRAGAGVEQRPGKAAPPQPAARRPGLRGDLAAGAEVDGPGLWHFSPLSADALNGGGTSPRPSAPSSLTALPLGAG